MKKTYQIIIVFLAMFIVSCESFVDEREELRIDPNNPLDSDVTNMIQGILVADQFFHTGEVARLAGLYTNHFSGVDRQYVTLNNWNSQTSGDMDSPWGTAYSSIVAQARIAYDKAVDEVNPGLAGVAQVVEAHAMGTITSLWGDVPFSEAGDIDRFPNPTYDAQASVYAGLQTLLDDALTNLNDPLASIDASKDIFYGGSVASWIELAYSLKARYYLHVEDYTNAAVNAALGISSPANDLVADFGGVYGASFNPYYSFLVYDRAGYMTAEDAYAPSIMDPVGFFDNTYGYSRNHAKHNEADRFLYYYQPFEFYGSGYEPAFVNDFDWGTTNGIFGNDFPLVTYGEMLLIIAEAEARNTGLSAGVTAYNDYRTLINSGYGFTTNNDGVSVSNYYGLTFGGTWLFDQFVDADFNPGGLEDPNSTASSPVNALLREIYEERYVYFSGNIESFTDFRRTDNIAEIVLKSGFTGTPQRMLYPQNEVNSNVNVPSPLPSVTDPTGVHM